MADTKIARFQIPGMDRVLRFEVPADSTPEQAHSMISDYLQKLGGGPIKSPTADMSTAQKVGAGAGKAFMDIGRGVGQIVGAVPQQSIDEAKSLDKPLMQTKAGIGGNILGNAAIFAPTAFIPGANTYTGAALGGAAMGALQPVATGESRALNTGLGAAAGAGGQAIGRGISRIIQPIRSALNPQEAQLAAAAAREGIPLSAGQATGSRPLQITESVMENLPFTSAPQLAQREAQQRAFTAATLRRAGMTGDVATAPAMLAQKQALGGRIGQIAEQNSLDFSKGLETRLSSIAADAESHLPPNDAARIAGTIRQIMSGSTPGKAEEVVASKILNESGVPFSKTIPSVPPEPMAGSLYQGWREPLRGLASEGGATGRYFRQIRSALDDSFREQMQGATKAEVEKLSRQYANLKTIIDAMGGAGKLPAAGQVSPAQLSGALARSVGRENKALGVGDLNELAKIGQSFVKDNLPDSFTAQKQFYRNLLTGNLAGAVPGAGIGYYEGRTPESALIGGLLGAGVGMGGPRLAQVMMNSPAGQAYLKNGLLGLTPEIQQALQATTSTLAPAGLLAIGK